MATINSLQEKQDQLEEDQEEEALSLCDLPITLINRKDHQDQSTKQDSPHINEEFDFRSWGSDLFSKEPEMCAADDVFFQGQILPLRFSFSSDSGSITKRDYGNNNQVIINRNSESEFFQSNSSRSSSVRSQNSSSSSSSTTSSTTTITTTTPTRISKPRIIRNQFHTHPSPKPQLRQTSTLSSNQGRKSSSAWEFFRLGVVPAPEIKLRSSNSNSNSANKNCVSRNSSNSSSNDVKKSAKIMSNKSTTHDGDKNNNNHHVFKQLVMGCKCSVETVVGSDIVMIKGGAKSTKKKESTQHAVKEEEKGVVEELKKQKHRSQKQGKKVMSHHRTFEWLKEFHACHDPDDEEALFSNP